MIWGIRHRLLVTVAVVVACAGITATAQGRAIGAYTTKGAFSFVSAPRLHPPKIRTDFATRTSKLAPGYFMIANFYNLSSSKLMVGQGGPLILDSKLQPVWFAPVGTDVVAGNLKLQTYNGKPALSWWEGTINQVGTTLSGKFVVVDQHYRQVATLTGADGWILSLHDMVISGGHAWVTAYKTLPNANLTAAGGPANGTLLDSAVQEYDLKSGKLLYTWDAFGPGHIPITESQVRPPAVPSFPWDAYHVNSIQLVKGGKFLVSMRNTWAAYLVDIKTGTIAWRLGGKSSSFKFSSGAQFHWQHDAQLHRSNRVSLYDDACCPVLGAGKFGPPNGPSRGLVVKLDLKRHTASRVSQYARGKKFNAAFLGSTQLLPNGNVAVGWGSQPFFSEFTRKGKFVFDAVLPIPNLTYRAYVNRWVGKPFFPPTGAVRSKNGKTTVYASWDGATQVAGWAVLGGANAKRLAMVATVPKQGFETAIKLTSSFKVYKVQALDKNGHVLRTSPSFSKPNTPPPPGFY